VQYEDIGVRLEVKPQIMRSDDVGLHLHLKIESLSGSSLNSIPVLNNQEVTTDLSVKSHWTTVLASNVYHSRVGSTTGYSSSVPTDKSATENDQQILVLLTPRIVRRSMGEEKVGLLPPQTK
jgi:type II secretory pathway component GspD/PulD (secretin)